jgi:hypothetical protein
MGKESELQALRVVDLKAILTEHGLDVKGKKEELVSVRAHTVSPPTLHSGSHQPRRCGPPLAG